jgi:hypothetical protein
MKRMAVGSILVLLSFVVSAQLRPPHWDHYRSWSRLLPAVEEQFKKEGLDLLFGQAEMSEFDHLFVTALVPVATDPKRDATVSGTFGLLVVFLETPGVENPPIAEIVRLDYYKTDPRTRATRIEGKVTDLMENGKAFFFGKPVLVLTLDSEGKFGEQVNQLVFERAGWLLKENCVDEAWKGVKERCRQESYLGWLGCNLSGWVAAKRLCFEYPRR